MNTQEAHYWNTEITNAEIGLEADCGDFLIACEAVILEAIAPSITREQYNQLPAYLKNLYEE